MTRNSIFLLTPFLPPPLTITIIIFTIIITITTTIKISNSTLSKSAKALPTTALFPTNAYYTMKNLQYPRLQKSIVSINLLTILILIILILSIFPKFKPTTVHTTSIPTTTAKIKMLKIPIKIQKLIKIALYPLSSYFQTTTNYY